MALPPSMRIRGHRCFNRLHRIGRRHHGVWMVLRVMNEEAALLRPELRRHTPSSCRCALVISNKVSKRSVRRNRLRRLFHGHLRQRLERRPDLAGRWVLISLRPEASEVEPSQLLKECDSLLSSAGLGT